MVKNQWVEVESIYSEFRSDRMNDFVGARISLSRDGLTLAVGSPMSVHLGGWSRTGHVKVFKKVGNEGNEGNDSWVLDSTIHGVADLDRFGSSVSLSENGTVVAVGADRFDVHESYRFDVHGSSLASLSSPMGFVEVYEVGDEEDWTIVGQRLQGEDCTSDERYHAYFGRDVSLSNGGKVLAVGGRGIVCVFEWNDVSGDWRLLGNPMGGDPLLSEMEFGAGVELAGRAKVVGISVPPNYVVYEHTNDEWEQVGQVIIEVDEQAEDMALKDWIGKALAMSDDGRTIASPYSASIYSLADDDATQPQWVVDQNVTATLFGSPNSNITVESVSMSSDGQRVAIGTVSVVNGTEVGKVSVLEEVDGQWAEVGEAIEGIGDFAGSVSLSGSGDTVVVGTAGQNNTETGGNAVVYAIAEPAPSRAPSAVPSSLLSSMPSPTVVNASFVPSSMVNATFGPSSMANASFAPSSFFPCCSFALSWLSTMT